MLRIGICAPYDLGRDGGVNSHIRAQARALRRLGHVVRVFGASSSPLPGNERCVSGCISPVIGATETGIGFDPRSWWRVGRLFDEERFDIVHVHEPLMPLVPWCAVWRARAPVVATFHTHREGGHRFYPRYRLLLEPVMRRVALRIAVSQAARRTVERHFPGEYDVIPNGIDVARFRRRAGPPPDLAGGSRHVLFVGRLEPRKGVEHLIDAMGWVQQHAPGVPLVVVGDGPGRAALVARAQAAAVDVRFAGRVPDDRLPACLQAADLVCSPATGGESFGIVLLEAMAAGRPVVATAIEGYEELAREAGPVRFVPPADAPALSREILTLLDDQLLRSRLGAAGVEFAARFDWGAVARTLERRYLDLLDRGRGISDGPIATAS